MKKRVKVFAFIVAILVLNACVTPSTSEVTKGYEQTTAIDDVQEQEETDFDEGTQVDFSIEVSSTPEETKNDIESIQEDTSESDPSEMKVHFIDVGQGDCTLITCDGEAMLIDAGDNSKGTTVQLYLKKQGIEKLKYVIGTHPDADHIGGLDVILYKYDCETIIMPDRSSDSNTYRDVIDTLDTKGYRSVLPQVGAEYDLGSARFFVLGPDDNYSDDNNCSVVIKVTHGENTFLFMGDAEEEAENDYIRSGFDISATVLKVAHHGSSSSTSKSFLSAVNPQYALISCGEDNSYGHPHAETLNHLRQQGCLVYRTDEQGSVVVTSDQVTLQWNCSPSDTWKAGEPRGSQQSNAEDTTSNESTIVNDNGSGATVKYILNTNTKKFHYPSCSSVKDMSDKNKRESCDSRDDIINQGFVPCKRCNP